MAPVTADATAFWAGPRPLDTYQRYWAATGQPHRSSLIGALHLLPRFTTLHEIGCAVGTNLRLVQEAFPWVICSGSDVNDGAIAFARKRLTNVTFHVGDALIEAARWRPDSVDVIISCYALAYVSPADLTLVLRAAVVAARLGVICVEPHGEPVGQITGLSFPEWRHSYAHTLQTCMDDVGRKGRINARQLLTPVDRCNGLIAATWGAS